MTTPAEYFCQRLETLRTDRSNWDSQWEEAASLLIPAYRNTFTTRAQFNAMNSGAKKTELQFDSTAAFAAQRFASVMESLATPQASVWHRLRATDSTLRKNRQVRMFFDDLSDLLFGYRYRPVGNFVGNSQQVYHGLGVFGNGVLYIDKPDEGKGVRYRNVHLGEVYFTENHAGIVDTVYRVMTLTARQVVEKFGNDAPEAVIAMARDPNRADKKEHEILHCVLPNSEYDPQRMDGPGRKFASHYVDVKTKTLMRTDGYYTFPYSIARYTQASGDVYGRGPAQHVLPAIKVLNQQKKTVLEQGHRVLAPVLLAHDDGTLGSFSLKPGALNAGGVNKDGRPLVHALPTGNIAIGEKLMELEKSIIHDAFLVTLFQILVDTPQMTATEVLERAREKGMLLAPTAGRLQAEFLGPLIEREIDVLARQGLLPKIPPILLQAEAEYRIEYDSPMSRMQRTEKVAGFMRALDSAGNYAKATGDVEPLDFFNFDTAMPEMLDIQGAPTAWTRSIEEVMARRDERKKAQQTQQMIDAAPAAASVAKTMMPAAGG